MVGIYIIHTHGRTHARTHTVICTHTHTHKINTRHLVFDRSNNADKHRDKLTTILHSSHPPRMVRYNAQLMVEYDIVSYVNTALCGCQGTCHHTNTQRNWHFHFNLFGTSSYSLNGLTYSFSTILVYTTTPVLRSPLGLIKNLTVIQG